MLEVDVHVIYLFFSFFQYYLIIQLINLYCFCDFIIYDSSFDNCLHSLSRLLNRCIETNVEF